MKSKCGFKGCIMKLKIGDLTNIRTGKLDANASSEDGQYPFFTCSKDPLKISTYTYDCECVLVAGNGDLNVKYYKGKFDAYQRTYIIEDNGSGRLYMPYLYYFMTRYVEQLRKQAIGGVIKYIKLGNLTNAEMELPTIEEQKIIVNIMEKAKHILDMKNQNIHNLNQLIQARFVEMFGTLDNPTQNFQTARLEELCSKITDGKHGGCVQEKGTKRYFVGAREIYDDKIHYDTAPEININEFEKDYKRCNVEIGDFLIVNTGATIGKSAIATDERIIHTLLQKSVALLKVRKELLNSVFLKWCYRVNTKMYMVESASAQANLLLSKIRKTKIYVPDINLQNKFASFVQQVNKSKFVIHKFLYCTTHNTKSIIKPRPNTKESGKIRGGKPHADEF